MDARKRAPAKGPVRRGVGMAACTWVAGAGGPPATVVVRLFADGSVNLNFGASDIGTGTKTIMAMVVAEELGVRPGSIQIEHADTGTTQFATPSGGSKTVPTEAPAVRAAAIDVKRQLLAMAAEQLEVDVADLDYRGADIVHRQDPGRVLRIPEVAGLRRRGVVVGVGHREPNPPDVATCPFGAQFCEVEVDTRTAEVRILRFVAAQESGRVMNRLTFDNQVHGGIAMGIGFGVTEGRVLDHGGSGRMLNANLHDYRVPTALDVPWDIESVAIHEPDDAANATGAKGLGEPVTIPTAAAVANAIFDAVGVRVTETPIAATLPSLLLDRPATEG